MIGTLKSRVRDGAIALVLAGLSYSSPAQILLWSTDLKVDPLFAKRSLLSWPDIVSPHLEFQGTDFLVVGYEDGAPNSPRTSPPNVFDFELIQVASESGKIVRKMATPVMNLNSAIGPTAGGDLLLLSGETLDELSSSFAVVHSYPTKLAYHGGPVPISINGKDFLSTAYEWWRLSTSPSGNTLVLWHKNRNSNNLVRLDASNLSVIQSIPYSSTILSVDAADDFVLVRAYDPQFTLVPENAFPVCTKCQTLIIANDESLIEDSVKNYRIVDKSGNYLLRGKLVNSIEGVAHSLNQKRVAFYTGSLLLRRGTKSRSIGRIVILDLQDRKEVLHIPFDEPAETRGSIVSGTQISLALSPDGKRLAVLVGSRLSCYLLPL